MSRDFLHPDHSIDKHGVHLPHWQQDEVMQFVTFRLGDALPRTKVLQWKQESEAWKTTWPPPWDAEATARYHERFTVKLERWLDEGAGSCLMRESHIRKIMEETLMHFQGERVEHHSWVIMPNHLHVLFKPMTPLDKLVQNLEIHFLPSNRQRLYLAAQLPGYDDPRWGTLYQCGAVYSKQPRQGEATGRRIYIMGE